MLGLVQDLLPPLAELNCQLFPQSAVPSPMSTLLAANGNGNGNGNAAGGEAAAVTLDGGTTSHHYAIVESDHPYKPATVANYRVSETEKKT